MKEISPDAYLIEPAARQIPVRFRRYPLGGHATIQHQGFRHRLFCPVTPNHWSAVGQRWKRTGKAVQFLTQGAQLTPALGFRGFGFKSLDDVRIEAALLFPGFPFDHPIYGRRHVLEGDVHGTTLEP
jgi:hypothetical protein